MPARACGGRGRGECAGRACQLTRALPAPVRDREPREFEFSARDFERVHVRALLLQGAGMLGDLLALAVALERDDRDAVGATLATRPRCGLRELLADQFTAFEWANSLFDEVGSPRAARRG